MVPNNPDNMTVVRLWHGKVPIEKADEYEQFLIKRAAPDYRSTEGLRKIYFTRRDESGIAHFLLITVWDSVDAIKRFADPEIAKYYPEDDDFLIEKEKYVKHYRIFYEHQSE